jgi:hypothetical protein
LYITQKNLADFRRILEQVFVKEKSLKRFIYLRFRDLF